MSSARGASDVSGRVFFWGHSQFSGEREIRTQKISTRKSAHRKEKLFLLMQKKKHIEFLLQRSVNLSESNERKKTFITIIARFRHVKPWRWRQLWSRGTCSSPFCHKLNCFFSAVTSLMFCLRRLQVQYELYSAQEFSAFARAFPLPKRTSTIASPSHTHISHVSLTTNSSDGFGIVHSF